MEKNNSKQMLFEMMSKIDSTFKSKVNELVISEDISIDVKVGDTIMTGRFKNKRTVVKSIGKDEHGMPTINGKKIVTFRKSTLPKTNENSYEILNTDKITGDVKNLNNLKTAAEKTAAKRINSQREFNEAFEMWFASLGFDDEMKKKKINISTTTTFIAEVLKNNGIKY